MDAFFSDGWVWAAIAAFAALGAFYYTRRQARTAEEQRASDEYQKLLDREKEAKANAKPTWPVVPPVGVALDRDVIGREEDVRRLRETLTKSSAVAVTAGTSAGAVVKGRGGLGKTTLAKFYIAKYRESYHGIWWLRAQAQQTVIEDLADLAATLGVGEADSAPEQRAKQVLVHLQSQTDPWLLVYDNAETMEDLRDWLPEGGKIHLLLTSREGEWPDRFTIQAADALDPEKAVALLRQESKREDDPNGALALVEALDFLPLAIVAAGAWLKDAPSESFADYQEKLAERIKHKPKGMTDYPDPVFGGVKLSLDKLSNDAALLMKVFCWLSPDDLWPALVTALASKLQEHEDGHDYWKPVPDVLWALARDASRVDRAFADLRDRSLLEHDEGDRWRLHRLTQEVQRSLLAGSANGSAPGGVSGPRGATDRGPGSSPGPSPEETERESAFAETSAIFVFSDQSDWRAVASAMVAAGYPYDSDFREHWPTCARLNPHIAALMRDPPATAAMDYLLNQASIYLDVQRRDELALSYSEKSLGLKVARLGEAHEKVATGYNNLSLQFERFGRFEEAEQHAARAVEISEALEDCDEAQSAIWLSNHGLMANHLSRRLEGSAREEMLALARRRYDEALEIDERLHGRESAEVAKSLINLADLWALQGLWEKALEASGEALTILRKVLDAGDPTLATSLNNLGGQLLLSGRVRVEATGESALDLLEQALAIREDAFADLPRHPDRVNTAGWLAQAHWCFEALGEAEADPARAAALCQAYGLDPELQKRLGLDCAARAIAWRERGEEPPGQMQILDAQRPIAAKDGPGAHPTG
ncbi:MAG: tetratricopeptide repeat protein [Pseudomonadota bacterium]